jgi:hypothetical protein
MDVHSFRLIGAAALAFAAPTSAQLSPGPHPVQITHGNHPDATADGRAAEFVDGGSTNVHATPLPIALLLLVSGLALARRAATRDRRHTRSRAAA